MPRNVPLLATDFRLLRPIHLLTDGLPALLDEIVEAGHGLGPVRDHTRLRLEFPHFRRELGDGLSGQLPERGAENRHGLGHITISFFVYFVSSLTWDHPVSS